TPINNAPEIHASRESEITRLAWISGAVKQNQYISQKPYFCRELELVLRGELQLAHGVRSAADATEGGRVEGQSWIAPVRVIESVKRLKADRQLVLFVVRHVERLV